MDSHRPHPSPTRTQWIIIGGAAFTALVIILGANTRFYREYENRASTPPPSPRTNAPVTVTIDFSNGVTRTFKGTPVGDMTAFAALSASAAVGKFQVHTDVRGNIAAIAGISLGGGKSWRLYVNNAPISDVPGNLDVHQGDAILFRYE